MTFTITDVFAIIGIFSFGVGLIANIGFIAFYPKNKGDVLGTHIMEIKEDIKEIKCNLSKDN